MKKRYEVDEKAAVVESSEQHEDKIRQRAYELYERRGGEDGHDLDDWLTAESELNGDPVK